MIGIFSLADELLEHNAVKICKVNHVTDFFPDVQPILSPLSYEYMVQNKEDRYFLPVILTS